MNRIFNMDNAFFRFVNRAVDAVILNLLFLLSFVPLFLVIYYLHNLPSFALWVLLFLAVSPIGPAYTAMYYFCLKAVNNEEGYLTKDFFKSFKLNYKQGFVIALIMGFVIIFLATEIKYTYGLMTSGGGIGWRMLFFVLIGVAIIIYGTFIYVFPLLSRFDNKTLITIRNAGLMSLKHLSTTVPLFLIGLLCIFIGWYLSPMSFFFIFGTWVYVSAFFLNKVFDRYYTKENPDRYEEDYYLGGQAEDATSENTTSENTSSDTTSSEDASSDSAASEDTTSASDNADNQ